MGEQVLVSTTVSYILYFTSFCLTCYMVDAYGSDVERMPLPRRLIPGPYRMLYFVVVCLLIFYLTLIACFVVQPLGFSAALFASALMPAMLTGDLLFNIIACRFPIYDEVTAE